MTTYIIQYHVKGFWHNLKAYDGSNVECFSLSAARTIIGIAVELACAVDKISLCYRDFPNYDSDWRVMSSYGETFPSRN